MAVFECLFGGVTDLFRRKKSDVDVGGQDRVIEVSVFAQHGILIIPKSWQGMRDEMVKRTQRVGTCHGVFKMLQGPKVSVKTCLHHLDDITSNLIRCDRDWTGVRDILGRGLAVVMVIIPSAAYGFSILHQISGGFAHLAIEIFHSQRFAPLCPCFKNTV